MKLSLCLVGLAAAACLAGCETVDKSEFIPQSRIEAAQANIAQQLAQYVHSAELARIAEARALTNPSPTDTWCGDGRIDYSISSVKVDLLTTLENNAGATVDAKAPLSAVSSVELKGGVSDDKTNSQELSYTMYMLPDMYEAEEINKLPDVVPDSAPIAKVILNQRNALIASAKRIAHPIAQACLVDFNPLKPTDDNGQLVIGIKGVKDTNGGITIALGPVSIGATDDFKRTSGNTITVNFKQRGLTTKSFIAPCDDGTDAPCVFTPVPTPIPADIANNSSNKSPQKQLASSGRIPRRNDNFLMAVDWASRANLKPLLISTATQAQPVAPPLAAAPPVAATAPKPKRCLQQDSSGAMVWADCKTAPKPQCHKSKIGIEKVPLPGDKPDPTVDCPIVLPDK